MTNVFRYINVSSGNIIGDTVTVTPTQEYTSPATVAAFDLQVGPLLEKYVNGKRVQSFRELNPTTGTEVSSSLPIQSLASTTAALACDLANGCRMAIAMDQAFTHASPSNIPPAGTEVVYYVTRTAAGGSFAMTWSSKHKGTWTTTAGTANQKIILWGESDGTNLVIKSSSGWY